MFIHDDDDDDEEEELDTTGAERLNKGGSEEQVCEVWRGKKERRRETKGESVEEEL